MNQIPLETWHDSPCSFQHLQGLQATGLISGKLSRALLQAYRDADSLQWRANERDASTSTEGLTVEGELELLVGPNDEHSPDCQRQVLAVFVVGVQHAICSNNILRLCNQDDIATDRREQKCMACQGSAHQLARQWFTGGGSFGAGLRTNI